MKIDILRLLVCKNNYYLRTRIQMFKLIPTSTMPIIMMAPLTHAHMTMNFTQVSVGSIVIVGPIVTSQQYKQSDWLPTKRFTALWRTMSSQNMIPRVSP